MEEYDIKDLEDISNIKAHTLRIWEKRYGLFIPDRTDSNIRRYNAADLKKLLNVTLLLQRGMKISSISKLSEPEIEKLILDDQSEQKYNIEDNFKNELIKSMIDLDPEVFEKQLNAIFLRYGIVDGLVKVVYPFLAKTGLLWTTNNIMPAQEHLVVNLIRQKLIAAIDGLNSNLSKDKVFILFLPPNEYHEIGLLLSHFIILNEGYYCYYLGQNVPMENVKETLKNAKKAILFTFIHDRNIQPEWINFLKENKTQKMLIVSDEKTSKRQIESKMITYINSPEQFKNFLK